MLIMELLLTRCCALTWVTKILIWAISNVHAGRRFPPTIPGLNHELGNHRQTLVRDTSSKNAGEKRHTSSLCWTNRGASAFPTLTWATKIHHMFTRAAGSSPLASTNSSPWGGGNTFFGTELTTHPPSWGSLFRSQSPKCDATNAWCGRGTDCWLQLQGELWPFS